MWEYIKQNNLQNPSNKKEIICDAKMIEVFNKKSFTMFEMTKLTSAVSYIIKLFYVLFSCYDVLI
jgi:chromatin remodeling complex protein RSC6